jgi:hypothetical protein
MAKKTPRKKSKAAPRTIEVKSRAYGTHTRAARGTIKPAKLNKVLSANSKRIALINPIASEVHTMLKTAAGFFKESMFWQKMLSRIHGANATTAAALLESIVGMDLQSRYPLQRFGKPPFVKCTAKKTLSIELSSMNKMHLTKGCDEYCFDTVVCFFTVKGKGVEQQVQRSKWFKQDEVPGNIAFDFALPKRSGLYLVCLRLHGGMNGVAVDFIATQGMMVVGAGRLKSK